MASGPDWGRISAIFGIVASAGGVAGFFFSPDTQRCTGLRGEYRGHPVRALQHCTDSTLGLATPPPDMPPSAPVPPPAATALAHDPNAGDPRALGGTHWVFYSGSTKTYVTFNSDGTVTFSDPAWGAGGVWELAGTRGVAFHTDAYDFGGTVGRSVPDSFEVSYHRLAQAGGQSEQSMTFTRVGSL